MTEEMELDFENRQKLSFSPQTPDQLLDLLGRIHQIPGMSSRGKAPEELNTPINRI